MVQEKRVQVGEKIDMFVRSIWDKMFVMVRRETVDKVFGHVVVIVQSSVDVMVSEVKR